MHYLINFSLKYIQFGILHKYAYMIYKLIMCLFTLDCLDRKVEAPLTSFPIDNFTQPNI